MTQVLETLREAAYSPEISKGKIAYIKGGFTGIAMVVKGNIGGDEDLDYSYCGKAVVFGY